MKIRISKEFTFETAHALAGYDGPCKQIHGHSYQLRVTLIGEPRVNLASPKNGMVLDFGDLKQIVKENIVDVFDHALLLNTISQTGFTNADNLDMFEKVVYFDFQPTSENLLGHIAEVLAPLMPSDVKLHSLMLRETGTSFAEWYASDNQ